MYLTPIGVCADVGNINEIQQLGHFDLAISNPPFGKVTTFKNAQAYRYTGNHAEYCVLDIASLIAKFGVFILPQTSAGFRFSGVQCYEVYQTEKYKRFSNETGLELDINIAIDTSTYEGWKGAKLCDSYR